MPPLLRFDDIDGDNKIYYIDTCVLYAAFSASQNETYRSEVNNALQAIIKNQSFVVTSALTFDELCSVIRRALINDARNQHAIPKHKKDKEVLRQYPYILQHVSGEVARIRKLFQTSLPSMICDYTNNTEFQTATEDFSAKHNVDIYDAKHLVITKSNGVDHFITTDSDFAYVSDKNMNIYLPIDLYNRNYTVVNPGVTTPIPTVNTGDDKGA